MSGALRILIDGYNLMFESGVVDQKRDPQWLMRSRERLISFLNDELDESELPLTQVVFDASKSRLARRLPPEPYVLNTRMKITFAKDYNEADELIEELIQQHPHPKTLLVVSSDHRIQKRAQARRAKSMDSDVFLDWLESDPKAVETERADDVPEELDNEVHLSETEIDFWLDEFDQDPPK